MMFINAISKRLEKHTKSNLLNFLKLLNAEVDYSLQKKRHLVKSFIDYTTNGSYLDVCEPHDAF
jgi:hypothetical protein